MAILKGRKAILRHTGRGWPQLLQLKRTRNFPMTKIGSRWESDTTEIAAWHKKQITQPSEELADV